MSNVLSAYDSRVVANSFLELASKEGRSIDPMKLQKLVYISHGYFLGAYDTPLIMDDVQAWDYGPVIPVLYRETKRFGRNPITEFYEEYNPSASAYEIPLTRDDENSFLALIWRVYGQYDAGYLSKLTHQEGTPWSEVYQEGIRGLVIPNHVIQKHYKELLHRNREARRKAAEASRV